jgi:four helix bundle protein
MDKIRSYQDLEVWKRGINIAVMVFNLTKAYPKEERYGMISQIRRAANSVPANISEGWGRNRSKEFIQFNRIAVGSLHELETHLLLSERCELAGIDQIKPILEELNILSKQIRALQLSLSNSHDQNH